jgi:hypothetical protein
MTDEKTKEPSKEQSTISEHKKSAFESLIFEGLKAGGVHIVASKSHGKSRLMFSIAETVQKLPQVRTIIFDGSETWLYAFSKIEVFSVGERDITEAQRTDVHTIEKYQLRNWALVKLALETHKDLLFRLKTRSPSKRGFFIRTIVNYLDLIQRNEKELSPEHENSKAISYFIEEAQDAFSNRSTSSTENETFLCVFNEARNNKESFWTASQRLTDFSKTIRAKQLQCIGKLSSEDITPALRRIEKAQNLDFSNMKPKTWFFNGSTFESPTWTQNGKPFQINKTIKEAWLNNLPKPKTLTQKISAWFNNNPFVQFEKLNFQRAIANAQQNKPKTVKPLFSDAENEEEDEEMDDLFIAEVDQ